MPTLRTPPAPGPAPDMFASLGDFVVGHLSPLYAQQVTDTLDAVWCPRWWAHEEAVARLWLCWRTFEDAARGGPHAISAWMLATADLHMAALVNPAGTFRYCSPRHGHKPLISPLPTDTADAPPEVFTQHLTSAPAVA